LENFMGAPWAIIGIKKAAHEAAVVDFGQPKPEGYRKRCA